MSSMRRVARKTSCFSRASLRSVLFFRPGMSDCSENFVAMQHWTAHVMLIYQRNSSGLLSLQARLYRHPSVPGHVDWARQGAIIEPRSGPPILAISSGKYAGGSADQGYVSIFYQQTNGTWAWVQTFCRGGSPPACPVGQHDMFGDKLVMTETREGEILLLVGEFQGGVRTLCFGCCVLTTFAFRELAVPQRG